jgi:cob(I)alamin adenosyltransferase
VSEQEERHWSIGELAQATGTTVRTLHHYDRVGLLVPAERSDGGHRRYGEPEVRRLYRILALRRLGFGLSAISSMLRAEGAEALLQTIRLHLARVEEQLEATEEMCERLRRIELLLERSEDPSVDDLLNTMEAMMTKINLTRIYTKVGDAGETHLGDMNRVPKTHPRIEAYGAVDELNAELGVALADPNLAEQYADWLRQIQNDLFDVGADLSLPSNGDDENRLRLDSDYVSWLERACDEVNRNLDPLDSFALPRGTALTAQLHVCRTVCRRAERRTVAVDDANPEIVRYLNRLSDLLFILSRAVNEETEELWEPGRRASAV